MFSRILRLRKPYSSIIRHPRQLAARRNLIAAPREGKDGPLMSRRSDRALPPIPSALRTWRTLPIFIAILIVSALGIFNYEKSSSSIVSATLYALRTSEEGRRELGDNIYFRDKFPWVWGKIHQLQGNVDISFAVKGTKGSGMMRFRSIRRTRMGRVSLGLLGTYVVIVMDS